jgi:hypothetical protein
LLVVLSGAQEPSKEARAETLGIVLLTPEQLPYNQGGMSDASIGWDMRGMENMVDELNRAGGATALRWQGILSPQQADEPAQRALTGVFCNILYHKENI